MPGRCLEARHEPGDSMKNALVINAHEPFPGSEGRLNATMAAVAVDCLERKGFEVATSCIAAGYEPRGEAEKHARAQLVVVQGPVYWMGFPGAYKVYQDRVYGLLGGGVLYDGDGRKGGPQAHYGSGGAGQGRLYLLSLTFNAPRAAFDDPGQYLFGGRGVDDLFFPAHMCFRFMGMEPLETFACYDVVRNPDVERDIERYRAHLDRVVA